MQNLHRLQADDIMESNLGEFGLELLDCVKMAEENKPAAADEGGKMSKETDERRNSVYSMKECVTETVVVYLDRAEVTRSVKANVKFGEYEIIVKELSACVDKDSIRVEGRGPATISEVAFQTKYLSPEEETEQTGRAEELKKKLVLCQKRKSILNTKNTRLKKQRSVLDGFADSVTKSSTTDKGESRGLSLNTDTLQGMIGFFDLYDKQAGRLDDSIHQINEDIERVEREVSAIQKELQELNVCKDPKEYKELSVLLDCTDDAEVELYISYVVSKAKWSPKYDIRVFSNEGQMKILYYGLIQQATGEDWNDAKICLSTAMPSIGGMVPDLGTQKLNFKQRTDSEAVLVEPRRHRHAFSRRSQRNRSMSFQASPEQKQQMLMARSLHDAASLADSVRPLDQECTSQDRASGSLEPAEDHVPESCLQLLPHEGDGNIDSNESMSFSRTSLERMNFEAVPRGAGLRRRFSLRRNKAEREYSIGTPDMDYSMDYDRLQESSPSMDVPQMQVKESITTTMYEIARRSTIPSDNVGHKVSVAIIDLQPSFEYESVPKKSAHAYLKARVKNSSPYAILSGPTNIFLDNNFIAKAELKAVSPSEDFTCSLGVDPAVKVTYKPVHKYREQSGLISKTVNTTYKQVIEVKNTHKERIKILIVDQVPLSTEEKIKVQLVEPVIKHPEKYDPTKPIRLNKMNNVEWEVEIPPGEFTELMLKYSVEHPVTEEVESNVVHFSPSSGSTEV